MTLLNRGTDDVVVFPEIATVDVDGNVRTKPSTVGTPCRAVIQPHALMVGDESQSVGFQSLDKHRIRLVGYPGGVLGAQSQIQWNGKRYVIHGEARIFNGSSRTRHIDYTIKRY